MSFFDFYRRKRKASSIVADGRMNQVIGSFDTLSISDGEEIGIRRGKSQE